MAVGHLNIPSYTTPGDVILDCRADGVTTNATLTIPVSGTGDIHNKTEAADQWVMGIKTFQKDEQLNIYMSKGGGGVFNMTQVMVAVYVQYL